MDLTKPASIDILVPTYGRPDRIARIVKNVNETTTMAHSLWFVVESDDVATIQAVVEQGLVPIINKRTRSYSGAINTGYLETSGTFVLAAADDLRFHMAWDTEAVQYMDGWVEVVGTNDRLNPYVLAGTHATHYLVSRRYLDVIGGVVDHGPGLFLNEGYVHNFTDTEFIITAKMRAKFRPCFSSVVEHLHWSTGQHAIDDINHRANAAMSADEALYNSRKDLWFNISR